MFKKSHFTILLIIQSVYHILLYFWYRLILKWNLPSFFHSFELVLLLSWTRYSLNKNFLKTKTVVFVAPVPNTVEILYGIVTWDWVNPNAVNYMRGVLSNLVFNFKYMKFIFILWTIEKINFFENNESLCAPGNQGWLNR